jgi:hypothetical protein
MIDAIGLVPAVDANVPIAFKYAKTYRLPLARRQTLPKRRPVNPLPVFEECGDGSIGRDRT